MAKYIIMKFIAIRIYQLSVVIMGDWSPTNKPETTLRLKNRMYVMHRIRQVMEDLRSQIAIRPP